MLRSGTLSATSLSISGMAEDEGLGALGKRVGGEGGRVYAQPGRGKTKGILGQEMQESGEEYRF